MKKIVFAFFFSVVLSIIIIFVVSKNQNDYLDEYGAKEFAYEDNVADYQFNNDEQILNQKSEIAKVDAINSGSTALLKLENNTNYDLLFIIMKSGTSDEYIRFRISKNSFENATLLSGDYYVNVRFGTRERFYYKRSFDFNIGQNCNPSISLNSIRNNLSVNSLDFDYKGFIKYPAN